MHGSAPSSAQPGGGFHPAPIVNPSVPSDLPALLGTALKTRCPPHQVAPGLWVRFHCGAFDRVKNARAANPGKLRMLRRGMLRLGARVGSAEEGDGGVTEETWRKALPPAVDHRALGTEGPVMNQGEVGCCSAFSLSSTMNNAVRRQHKDDAISPMHLWSHYFVEGMAAASANNAKRPLALLAPWPYDERVGDGPMRAHVRR